MKTTRFFLMVLAVAVLASCAKNSETDFGADSKAKKSVTFTIKNQKAPLTRAVQNGYTGDELGEDSGIKVADVSDLYAIFADEDDNVIGTPVSLGSVVAPTDENPDNLPVKDEDTYTFHLLDPAVRKVAITSVSSTETTLDAIRDEIDDFDVEDYQSLAGTPVWGVGSEFVPIGEDIHDDGTTGYEVYYLGAVSVEPVLARIEIGNIECTDLNGGADESGNYPRFGKLTLSAIGIHDTQLGTIGGEETTYGVDDFDTWYAAGWNRDEFTAELDGKLETPVTSYDDQVFAYNVVAGDAPNIILELSDEGNEANSNIENPGPVTGPYFVRSTGLSVSSFSPGVIYRVNFEFTCADVKAWDTSTEFICVNVEVEIPDWTIYDDLLTPTFD